MLILIHWRKEDSSTASFSFVLRKPPQGELYRALAVAGPYTPSAVMA